MAARVKHLHCKRGIKQVYSITRSVTPSRPLMQDSMLSPWLNLLPASFDTPLHFSESQLQELQGTTLHAATRSVCLSVCILLHHDQGHCKPLRLPCTGTSFSSLVSLRHGSTVCLTSWTSACRRYDSDFRLRCVGQGAL